MTFFSPRTGKRKRRIEMTLDHDGSNWVVSRNDMTLAAPSLEELDRKVEQAIRKDHEFPLEIFMCCNNEMIPMWMRPYMNHYFNRILELPLRHRS